MRRSLLALAAVLLALPVHAQGVTVLGGAGAGTNASGSSNAVVAGINSGNALLNSPYSVLYGDSSGQTLKDSLYATVIGPSAARFSEGGEGTIYVGLMSGYLAKVSVRYSTMIGYAAGRYVENNTYSNIFGYAAGEYSHRSHQSVFVGNQAGYRANDSGSSVMLGRFSGAYANNSPNSVFIGYQAGGVEKTDAQTSIPSANYVTGGVYIGAGAGKDSSHTSDVVLIGTNASAAANVDNAIALGRDARAMQSNSMNVPVLARAGGGVLEADANGNVTSTDRLAAALAAIADLQSRVITLENR